MKQQFLLQLMLLGALIISLALVMVGCNGAGNINPFSQLTQDEIEVTVEVEEPIQIKQPFVVTITVVTKEDIPDLEVIFSTGDPDIKVVDGFSDFWVVDSVAQQPMIFTTTIQLISKGLFNITAFAKDPSIARVVSDHVNVDITDKGVVVNPTPHKDSSALTIVTSTYTTYQDPVLMPYPTVTSQSQRSVNHLKTPIGDNGEGGVVYTIFVPDVPPNAIVTDTSIKLLFDHPHSEELKVILYGPDHITTVTLWEYQTKGADNLYEGLFYINQRNLSQFNGLPAAKGWALLVQDDVAGNAGTLESITLAVNYEIPNTLPTNTDPTQGSQRPQSSSPPEPTPNANEGHSKPNNKPIAVPISSFPTPKNQVPQGTWVTITTEDFEGIFPNYGWSIIDWSNDGKERFWDDDDYRPHTGGWAAWPANGGDDGIYPVPDIDHYPNNMNTQMIYGPFDLSDTVRARGCDIYILSL